MMLTVVIISDYRGLLHKWLFVHDLIVVLPNFRCARQQCLTYCLIHSSVDFIVWRQLHRTQRMEKSLHSHLSSPLAPLKPNFLAMLSLRKPSRHARTQLFPGDPRFGVVIKPPASDAECLKKKLFSVLLFLTTSSTLQLYCLTCHHRIQYLMLNRCWIVLVQRHLSCQLI